MRTGGSYSPRTPIEALDNAPFKWGNNTIDDINGLP
jgi:hypothetical protein